MLLGAAVAGIAVTVARVAGIALIGLGVACWPGPPILGMLIYSTGVGLFLGWLGLTGGASGVLLWPAAVAHVVLSALLARDWLRSFHQRARPSPRQSRDQLAEPGAQPRSHRRAGQRVIGRAVAARRPQPMSRALACSPPRPPPRPPVAAASVGTPCLAKPYLGKPASAAATASGWSSQGQCPAASIRA